MAERKEIWKEHKGWKVRKSVLKQYHLEMTQQLPPRTHSSYEYLHKARL